MVGIPLVLLYEASILISYIVIKKREKQELES
jgi:Sec-independent protein secretion pathway component TatC